MKTNIILLLVTFLLASCVQKTFKRIIVVTVDVSKQKNIRQVGIRGNGNPLSWETDFPMKEVVKDSLYKAVIKTETGYLFGEVKCTLNGNFELKDKPNRRIYFDTQNDTTYMNLIFDREK